MILIFFYQFWIIPTVCTETFCQTVAENLNNIVFFFIYNKLIDVPVIFFSNKAATAQVQAESGSAFLFVIRRLKNNYLK